MSLMKLSYSRFIISGISRHILHCHDKRLLLEWKWENSLGNISPYLLCFDDHAQSKVIVCCQALNRLVMVFKFPHLSELKGSLFATTPTHLWVRVVRL